MTPDRFWRRVHHDPNGCWTWTGPQNGYGYGRYFHDGRYSMAHRWAYEQLAGPITEGKQLDHLCRNRLCVNPEHLEQVTIRENVLRGVGPTALNARRAECVHGHPLDGENLLIDYQGKRRCRACGRRKSLTHRMKVAQ